MVRCRIELPRRSSPRGPLDFIREIVAEDLRAGKHGGRVHTRFPPEPNGYLHIGHAKSICLNFGVAARVRRQLQPALRRHQSRRRRTSSTSSRSSDDVRWLGFDWDDRLFYASDYFEQLYDCAEQLIEDGKAYVDSLTRRRDPRVPRHADRAGPQQPVSRPRASTRTSTCSARMRAGEFPDGAHVLRAKIDMASPNINMRDPVLYRIRHADAPPHRRRVVHLPDVRLRAPDLGRDRGHHALDLHARVRGPPAALRLGGRAHPRRGARRRGRSRSSSRG